MSKKNDGAGLNSRLIRRPIQRWAPLFILPVFAAFCIGFVWPFLQGIYLSFCTFNIPKDAKWVGLTNYSKIWTDVSFWNAFKNTAFFAVVSILLINVLAFFIAYALTQKMRGSNLFRTVFFMPNLIGGVVLGYIWSMIFDGILRNYATYLTANATYGFWGLVILVAWQQIGYMMIIYIAGLQAVPGDMLEAAEIDGQRQPDAVQGHHPQRDALHHHLHLPDPDQLLQAVRPEPGADRRSAQRHSERREVQPDRAAGAEHLLHLQHQ